MKQYLVALLIVLLASCNSENAEKKYGIDFNKNRLELGLPVLQSDWKLVKNDQSVLRWAPEGSLTGVGFIHKHVTI